MMTGRRFVMLSEAEASARMFVIVSVPLIEILRSAQDDIVLCGNSLSIIVTHQPHHTSTKKHHGYYF